MLKAQFFDGTNAQEYDCHYSINRGSLVIYTQSQKHIFSFDQCELSTRVGKQGGSIDLPNNQLLTITDFHQYNEIYTTIKGKSFINSIEDKKGLFLTFILLAVLLIFSFIKIILPQIRNSIIEQIPYSFLETLSESNLELIKDTMELKPSSLTKERKSELQKIFDEEIVDPKSKYKYELIFLDADFANAFALPSGKIIVTDPLVEEMTNNNILAILLHEKAHVEYNHALKGILNSIGIIATTSLIFGDIASVLSPEELIINKGSRDFELEADKYSGEFCIKKYNSPTPMIEALEKLYELSRDYEIDWFSTHPNLKNRIQQLEKLTTQ